MQELTTDHISQQFNNELEQLRQHFLTMGGVVENQVQDSIQALLDSNGSLAEDVKDKDATVNQLDGLIDEECTRILAKRQPAASDLRMILSISKAVSELERMGDEAKKIANLTLNLINEGESPRGYVEINRIGQMVSRMIHDALDAYARLDIDTAIKVAKQDRAVDQEYNTALRSLVTYMMEDPRSISRVINVIWVLRSLERIGDHARHTCQHLIFMVKGVDVRHVNVNDLAGEVKDA
ncbi:phosphate signaling complex protein PhoU [Marinomonas posidonica]|uniref:Phosphate-specific transport system accessory protein PhoU n=1 Tax=Marinomonas posidonica (strain CECT 7376 / NCIMB 14433 / IVIA-Po-181) TaxID=491952 RepID=F6CVN6_MARPP|nr:phosphate signaling complex protein PhoU [Marinomonas posidonica]AEF56510.1 phosphate uptake regulator, PhoU [Marinomonas posidonica IVIA-Po-181]